jgi:hypothetical protein
MITGIILYLPLPSFDLSYVYLHYDLISDANDYACEIVDDNGSDKHININYLKAYDIDNMKVNGLLIWMLTLDLALEL